VRTYRIKADSELAGRKCDHCPRRLRVGQVVLHHRILGNQWNNQDFAVHAECVERVMKRAPKGRPVRPVTAELARIDKTGVVLGPA
jgi:hypothetical protein